MLGEAGANLWASIMAESDITDTGGLALLTQVCAATDRISEYSEIIARDGPMIATKHGPKEHPLLKLELASRAFIVRTLQRLGLNLEPIKPIDRPPTRYGA
jgi:hypothetical protein